MSEEVDKLNDVMNLCLRLHGLITIGADNKHIHFDLTQVYEKVREVKNVLKCPVPYRLQDESMSKIFRVAVHYVDNHAGYWEPKLQHDWVDFKRWIGKKIEEETGTEECR